MSHTLVEATDLLCNLLEQPSPTINGAALFGGDVGSGGRELVRERLLTVGSDLSHVTCPDCGIEIARVVRPMPGDKVRLCCDECGEVEADSAIRKHYTVSLSSLIEKLVNSLGLPRTSLKVILPDRAWRLGVQEPKRGKALTWYFARHLQDHAVAHQLLVQIRADHATTSARIITSTPVPLPEGSPLTGYDVKHLAAIARLSQSVFLLYGDRTEVSVAQPEDEPVPGTSLRHVRDHSAAYVDGVKYELQAMQRKILLALMEAHGHRLEGNQIGERCGSSSFPFQPAKHFGHINKVRQAFIRFDRGDKVYELIVHPEDQDFL